MTFADRAIVVDGGAALEEDLERGIVVVPQRIGIGDREFIDDGKPESYADFYRMLRGGATTTTATPSPGAYLDAFRRSEAETILCLTIPERWSGMHSTANLAAEMLAVEEARRWPGSP
jgi:fatty acid-binding protein DegV